MKKFYKTFTFCFVILSIVVVILNIAGKDEMNILMIGLNPVLNLIDNSNSISEFMSSYNYAWHIASIITNLLYGLLLDYIKCKIKTSK